MERQSSLDRRHVADKSLAGRAAIDVILGDVDEVLFAEAAVGLGA